MKKVRKIVAVTVMLAMSMISVLPAQAAKIIMSGNTDPDAIGITVLVANSEADVDKLSGDDVFWIDQWDVDENGRFTVTFPEFDTSKYTLRTNANAFDFEEGKTVYVSSNGSADKLGENASEPTTFENAVKNSGVIKEIILLDNITYKAITLPGDVVIKGNVADVMLTLTGTVYLSGKLKIDNLTINSATTFVANGNAFEITDTVTSTERLNVYGGGIGTNVESTNIKLEGGLYSRIYGGGMSGGTVTGDTNVIVSGNVNVGDGVNDDADNISPCYVLGGGNNAKVLGKTNVTIDGNAVTKYVMGAGMGTNGTAAETNVYIKGGNVMNVFGGSDGVELSDANTNVTMTGGMAEGVFGGSSSAGMTGSTCVKLLGGEVTRRVYAGCYNSRSLTWNGTCHVTGTTTLILTPQMSGKLSTGNGLSAGSSSNMGVYAGSCVADNYSDEHNTIIYSDDCYDALHGEVAATDGFLTIFKSHTDYVVKASENGEVMGTNVGGKVQIVPDEGRYGCVNGTDEVFFKNETATINPGENTVVFNKLVSADKTAEGVTVNAAIDCAEEGEIVAAVYDMSGTFIACDFRNYDVEIDGYSIDVPCELETGKSYIVKLFLWDSVTGMTPHMSEYYVTVQ